MSLPPTHDRRTWSLWHASARRTRISQAQGPEGEPKDHMWVRAHRGPQARLCRSGPSTSPSPGSVHWLHGGLLISRWARASGEGFVGSKPISMMPTSSRIVDLRYYFGPFCATGRWEYMNIQSRMSEGDNAQGSAPSACRCRAGPDRAARCRALASDQLPEWRNLVSSTRL